ncbi:MAG: glycosyltransferase family 2 protein [Victivallaceae bacterium]
MNVQPLVSVIVPCYKQAEFLPETLDSVLGQTYSNWECIIVNDGSPDNTDAVTQQYLTKSNRFKYITQQNSGPSVARNAGIKNSSGKYILPLDADDLIGAEYLSSAVVALEQDSTLKLVYCRVEFFGEKCGEWALPEYSPSGLLAGNMIFNTALFRRSDFDLAGGYDESFRNGHEDWDFWLSLLLPDGKVLQLPEILFYYRIRHASRQNSMSREKVIADGFKIYEKHKAMYLRFWGSPQQYLMENQLLKNDLVNLIKSPRMKLADILFMPVDLIRKILKK